MLPFACPTPNRSRAAVCPGCAAVGTPSGASEARCIETPTRESGLCLRSVVLCRRTVPTRTCRISGSASSGGGSAAPSPSPRRRLRHRRSSGRSSTCEATRAFVAPVLFIRCWDVPHSDGSMLSRHWIQGAWLTDCTRADCERGTPKVHAQIPRRFLTHTGTCAAAAPPAAPMMVSWQVYSFVFCRYYFRRHTNANHLWAQPRVDMEQLRRQELRPAGRCRHQGGLGARQAAEHAAQPRRGVWRRRRRSGPLGAGAQKVTALRLPRRPVASKDCVEVKRKHNRF